VALDVDGTVLGHDGRLSERVRSAVHAVADAGVHVVVASGREVRGLLPVLDRLGLLDGWAVCSNGAVTIRLDPGLPDGFEVVHVVTFDTAPVLALLREHLPTALYAVEEVGVGLRLNAPFPPGELDGRVRVVPFDELAIRSPRVVVRAPERARDEFLAQVERIGLHGVSHVVGWSAWLDIAPEGVTKVTGLEEVRRRLDVDRAAVLAVGDGGNDLDMFAWAGRSVAMGQALPEVRRAADQVTVGVTEDGLAVVLESLLVGGVRRRRPRRRHPRRWTT
jgi:hydroxymethylpyrimidine pyrophosphatase-like HAD family hydrolase